jgi:hypothetical protein
MKTDSLDLARSPRTTSSCANALPAPRRAIGKLKTGVRGGTPAQTPIVWTYTKGGVTHEDAWNEQTLEPSPLRHRPRAGDHS